MSALNNLTGCTFGKLTVLSLERIENRRSYWSCACACGGEAVWRGDHIQARPNPACKACEGGIRSAAYTQHGACLNGTVTPLYRVWMGMSERCNSATHKDYRYYGGKGIRLCAEWTDFKNFETWAMANGYTKGLTIDRVNPALNYAPSNCEWVTMTENVRRSWVTRRVAA